MVQNVQHLNVSAEVAVSQVTAVVSAQSTLIVVITLSSQEVQGVSGATCCISYSDYFNVC